MKLFVSICLLFGALFTTIGQQLPKVYNQFFMNPYIYNPAYAGVEGHAVLFFMYKNQWGNIDGAPSYMHANFHVPLKGGIAFGGLVENQTEGVINRSSGKISGGYLVTLDREHFLRFGMSLGGGNYTLNSGEFDSNNDPAFANIADNNAFLLGDFGATYHFGHFNVGFSLPQLFSYDVITPESESPVRVNPTDNILFKMNYRGHINDNIAIEPHLIYRYSNVLPNQIEATVILHVFHVVWVGASYRHDAGAVGLLGIKIKEKIGIGYSYETGNPNIASLLGPSHEVHIGYHLGTKKEHAEHVSSFIKSHRKSAELRAKEAELDRQRKLQALQQSRESQTQDEDALSIVSAPKTEETPKKEAEWVYEKEDNLVERINTSGDRELGVKFDRINTNGEKEVVFSWLPPPPVGVSTETYQIANPNEAPRERIASNGQKEVGVKWIRSLDNGQTETLVVWDPVLTEAEASQIDHSPSQQLSMENAKITISAPEVTPQESLGDNYVLESQQSISKEEAIENEYAEELPENNAGISGPIERSTDIPNNTTEEANTTTNTEVKTVSGVEIINSQADARDNNIVNEEQPADTYDTSNQVKDEKEIEDVDTRSHEELAKSEDHLEVKRGNHLLELPKGNHLIAGAFKSFQLAENYSDQLFERGFHDTKVGYVTERGYYYVVVFQSDNMDVMKRQKTRTRNLSGLSKVWILKVN